MEKMSIQRALDEVSTLDKRINSEISRLSIVSVAQGKKPVQGYATNDEFVSRGNSSLQSINDLMKRRNLIKSLIIKSNANTNITINGEEMSIAKAIETKQNVLEMKQALLGMIKGQLMEANKMVERNNANVNAKLDELLKVQFGKESKAKSEEVEAIATPYLSLHEAKVVSPDNIKEIIEKLENEMESLKKELNYVIVESNTQTFIEL
jgi:hypothetical protein